MAPARCAEEHRHFFPEYPVPPGWIQQTRQVSCATNTTSTACPDKADHRLSSVQKLYLHIFYRDLFDVTHPSPVTA